MPRCSRPALKARMKALADGAPAPCAARKSGRPCNAPSRHQRTRPWGRAISPLVGTASGTAPAPEAAGEEENPHDDHEEGAEEHRHLHHLPVLLWQTRADDDEGEDDVEGSHGHENDADEKARAHLSSRFLSS